MAPLTPMNRLIFSSVFFGLSEPDEPKAMAVWGLLREINLRIIADVEALAKAGITNPGWLFSANFNHRSRRGLLSRRLRFKNYPYETSRDFDYIVRGIIMLSHGAGSYFSEEL